MKIGNKIKTSEKRYIILSHKRGDYITGISESGKNISGGDAVDAIRYTRLEAESVIDWLGKRDYSIEETTH